MDDGSVDVSWDEDRHVTSSGDQVHQYIILTLRTRHEDTTNAVAGVVHRSNDLAGLKGDELHSCVVVKCQAINGFVAAQSNY